jgi:hypothetical protein
MSDVMTRGAQRFLTDREWSALSEGLAVALEQMGVRPRIVAKAAIGARVAGLWRGGTPPVLAWKDTVYWPGALEDFAVPHAWRQMAVLQHELHHLWEYAAGRLTWLGYGLNPRNWAYRYDLKPHSRWSDFGAEQRACIAEDLWLIEHGHICDREGAEARRRLLPWRA